MVSTCKQLFSDIQEKVAGKLLFGADETLRLAIITYLAQGHLLIEGPPGTGKTLTAHILARLFAQSFKRIQFTSDMLPADMLGAHIYDPSKKEFTFIKGPIFSDCILADEINRTPPRTQSALLEAMEERQVTVEGKTFELSPHFFVVATQNPREFDGTFPLPEAQLDRFMMKIVVTHQNMEQEVQMLTGSLAGVLPPDYSTIKPIELDRKALMDEVKSVHLEEVLGNYIIEIVAQTRSHPMLRWGSSFRGAIALAKCARVAAATSGKDFISPDDIIALVTPTLQHRVRLTPEAEIGQQSVVSILDSIVKSIPFPG